MRVKVRDKTQLAEAKDELTGLMRRVRGLPPEKKNDFNINEQQAFKSTLDPVKNSIAMAGLFITGLSLFVGAIGIMNITFVSVKERTKEIGTRKALGRAAAHHPAPVPDRIDRALHARRSDRTDFAYIMCFGDRRSVSLVPDSVFVRAGLDRACLFRS